MGELPKNLYLRRFYFMKEYEIISKSRKAQKGNVKAEIELIIWYGDQQYYRVPSDICNIHGLTGHGSIFYTAEEMKSEYNKEFNDALYWIASRILED